MFCYSRPILTVPPKGRRSNASLLPEWKRSLDFPFGLHWHPNGRKDSLLLLGKSRLLTRLLLIPFWLKNGVSLLFPTWSPLHWYHSVEALLPLSDDKVLYFYLASSDTTPVLNGHGSLGALCGLHWHHWEWERVAHYDQVGMKMWFFHFGLLDTKTWGRERMVEVPCYSLVKVEV